MLANYAKEFGPSWDVHLKQVLFAYRARPHTSTGESPFYMVYGRDPRLPTETDFSTTLTGRCGGLLCRIDSGFNKNMASIETEHW